jgi:hypothetical protein
MMDSPPHLRNRKGRGRPWRLYAIAALSWQTIFLR